MKYSISILFVLGLAGIAAADEVKLRNGGTLIGTTREEPGKVVIDTGLGTVTLAATDVEAILPETPVVCQKPVMALGTTVEAVAPSAMPSKPQKARVQERYGYATPKKAPVQRYRSQAEISPGYVYLGIPPSVPPRGSQNHGYGGSTMLAYPTPVRGLYVSQ